MAFFGKVDGRERFAERTVSILLHQVPRSKKSEHRIEDEEEMTEEEETKGMPPLHALGNTTWTKVFNWRNKSDIKDVACPLIILSPNVWHKIDWNKAPKGYRFDVWLKKEILRVSREENIKIEQFPVGVKYYLSKTSLKSRLSKYGRMFFEVLYECLKK